MKSFRDISVTRAVMTMPALIVWRGAELPLRNWAVLSPQSDSFTKTGAVYDAARK